MLTPPVPLVGIIMGSKNDHHRVMVHASQILIGMNIPHEVKLVSAHRTPDLLYKYAKEAQGRGLEVIIAGAGGAAHLPGMCASMTVLPVIGVPIDSTSLMGLDALLSVAQMPAGVPVATMPVGRAGAINAALLAVAILGNSRPEYRAAYADFRQKQTYDALHTELDNPQ